MSLTKNIIDLAIIVIGLSLIAVVYHQIKESLSSSTEAPQIHMARPLPKVLHAPVPLKEEVFPLPSQPEPNIPSIKSSKVARTMSDKSHPPALPSVLAPSSTAENDQGPIQAFINWSKAHDIELIGINKSVNDFYYGGASKKDFLPIDNISNVLEVAKGLYLIPEPLLAAMKGKTIYISHQEGRGYTVLGSWPERNILQNVERGNILEQPLSVLQTVHEFAHILDFHGIQGIYEDENNSWKWLKEMRDDIFAVDFTYNPKLPEPPAGYIDVYSTANSAENFAQHFTFYLLRGREFRERAIGDGLLQQKYDFFSEYIFEGREY